jgi:hypothetical protein
MEASKACTQCGIVKPLSEFPRKSASRDGRSACCRICTRKQQKEFRDSGKQAKYHRDNPHVRQLSTMVANSRRRAKEKNLDHNIDVAYLRSICPSHCPYLGVKLRWEVQDGLGMKAKAFHNSPSLDRIDGSKGYVRGNVAIVSYRANTIKQDATEQELIQMGQRIAELKMQLACEELCSGA